jgi:hypothetical protein
MTLVLILSAVSVGVAPVAADGLVSVSTTIEPSQPTPEEEFTIQTTITSSADSSSNYRLVDAEVRRGPGDDAELVSKEGVRTTVAPGETKTVDVDATLNESGTQDVFLRLIFRDNTGDRRVVVQQETVQVIEGHPQTSVSTDAALPGDDQTMTVRLSNGLSAAIDNVELTVEGEDISVRNSRRVTATVASGGSESFEFRVTPDAETVQPVTVTVQYSFEGNRRSVDYRLRPDFTPTSDIEHPQAAVSTDAALPGDDQTMTVRLSNGLSAAIDNVELTVEGEDISVRNSRRVTATVASGGSESFEFRVTPDAETVQPVTVTVQYSFEGDRRSVDYQLRPDFTPTSDTEQPQVAVSTEAGEAGESRAATVTLSNGLDENIRNVELTVGGERVEFDSPRRVAARIEAGATKQYEFTATPAVAERLPVEVSLSYTVGGEQRGAEYTFEPSFGTADAPADRPQLQVDVEEAVAGASRPVTVTVANGLGNEVRQLELNVSSPDVTFQSNTRVRSVLQAGGTAELAFSAVAEESGVYPVQVTFDYRDDGVQQQVTRTFDVEFAPPSNPGRVQLTDVDAVAEGDSLELSATASNVGSERVESVIVSLPDSADVSGREYFVGGIDGSDFSSFTISTTVDRNVTSVPVEVTYVVDGVQKTVTTEVAVEQTALRQASESSDGGSVPLIPIAVVGVLVIVLGVAYRVRG